MANKYPWGSREWKDQKGGDGGDRICTYIAKLNNSNP